MNIKKMQLDNIPQLVVMDHNAYGQYGADEEYFRKKLTSPKTKILIAEKEGLITGFTVFEMMEQDEMPKNFSDLKINKLLKGKWMYIIAFTTETNYEDVKYDSQLLRSAEKIARNLKCNTFCVPLSKDHPYPKAYNFFEINGYQKVGSIKWKASPTEKIDCYLYLKSTS